MTPTVQLTTEGGLFYPTCDFLEPNLKLHKDDPHFIECLSKEDGFSEAMHSILKNDSDLFFQIISGLTSPNAKIALFEYLEKTDPKTGNRSWHYLFAKGLKSILLTSEREGFKAECVKFVQFSNNTHLGQSLLNQLSLKQQAFVIHTMSTDEDFINDYIPRFLKRYPVVSTPNTLTSLLSQLNGLSTGQHLSSHSFVKSLLKILGGEKQLTPFLQKQSKQLHKNIPLYALFLSAVEPEIRESSINRYISTFDTHKKKNEKLGELLCELTPCGIGEDVKSRFALAIVKNLHFEEFSSFIESLSRKNSPASLYLLSVLNDDGFFRLTALDTTVLTSFFNPPVVYSEDMCACMRRLEGRVNFIIDNLSFDFSVWENYQEDSDNDVMAFCPVEANGITLETMHSELSSQMTSNEEAFSSYKLLIRNIPTLLIAIGIYVPRYQDWLIGSAPHMTEEQVTYLAQAIPKDQVSRFLDKHWLTITRDLLKAFLFNLPKEHIEGLLCGMQPKHEEIYEEFKTELLALEDRTEDRWAWDTYFKVLASHNALASYQWCWIRDLERNFLPDSSKMDSEYKRAQSYRSQLETIKKLLPLDEDSDTE